MRALQLGETSVAKVGLLFLRHPENTTMTVLIVACRYSV